MFRFGVVNLLNFRMCGLLCLGMFKILLMIMIGSCE